MKAPLSLFVEGGPFRIHRQAVANRYTTDE